MPVLKLDKDDEAREIEFELHYLTSLTVKERFHMMHMKSEEMKYLTKLKELTA
jgi:hypothetical protein